MWAPPPEPIEHPGGGRSGVSQTTHGDDEHQHGHEEVRHEEYPCDHVGLRSSAAWLSACRQGVACLHIGIRPSGRIGLVKPSVRELTRSRSALTTGSAQVRQVFRTRRNDASSEMEDGEDDQHHPCWFLPEAHPRRVRRVPGQGPETFVSYGLVPPSCLRASTVQTRS